jgi:hypothetical protein
MNFFSSLDFSVLLPIRLGEFVTRVSPPFFGWLLSIRFLPIFAHFRFLAPSLPFFASFALPTGIAGWVYSECAFNAVAAGTVGMKSARLNRFVKRKHGRPGGSKSTAW